MPCVLCARHGEGTEKSGEQENTLSKPERLPLIVRYLLGLRSPPWCCLGTQGMHWRWFQEWGA